MKIRELTGRILLIAMMAAPASCGHNHAEGHGHDHESEEEHDAHAGHEGEKGEHEGEAHSNDVVMSHEALEAASIKIEEVSASDFAAGVKTTGVIENPTADERVISAPASGMLTSRAGIVPGSKVAAGEHLFTISSKGTEQGDASATAKVDLALAEKELARAEQLIKDNLISRKEYERIRTEAERARLQAGSVAARSREAVGISSPIGGYIVSLTARSGQYVETGAPLAIVVTGRRLMLRADLSERYRSLLGQLKSANIRIPGNAAPLDLSQLGGKVAGGVSGVTEGSHYYPVYIEFDNPGGLTGGAAVEVWLKGETRSGVVTLPKSAIVEDGGFHYVYVEEEHGVFEKKEVKLGGFDGIRYEILSGVEPGEKVAVEGALKIKMAGMGNSIQGHHHHH